MGPQMTRTMIGYDVFYCVQMPIMVQHSLSAENNSDQESGFKESTLFDHDEA
jgi:hypothetical protein